MAYEKLNGDAKYGAISVSTTPVELKSGVTALEGRIICTIQPMDGDIYFGYDNQVTYLTGTKIFEGVIYPFEATETLPIWIVTETGTVDCRVTEAC